MRNNPRTTTKTLVYSTLAAGLLLAACADDEATVSTFDVTADDFSFELSEVPSAGSVELVINNQGAEAHHIQMLRLDDGQDGAAVVAALEAGDVSGVEQGTFVGGPGAALPGVSQTALAELAAGSYVIFCEIQSPESGEPHYAQGMVAAFDVEDDGRAIADAEPEAVLRITDGGYQLPEGFDGSGDLQVVNDSSHPAQAEIFRLQGGATPEDIVAFFTSPPSGPPPFITAGGVTSLDPGEEAVARLELESGDYAVLSFAPDPATGAPGFITGGLLSGLTIP